MNRRGFLGALGAAIAGATLDPERELWVPGKKLISIPRVHVPVWLQILPGPSAIPGALGEDVRARPAFFRLFVVCRPGVSAGDPAETPG